MEADLHAIVSLIDSSLSVCLASALRFVLVNRSQTHTSKYVVRAFETEACILICLQSFMYQTLCGLKVCLCRPIILSGIGS